MNRTYASGTNNNAKYFVGTEVEHTPAYGLRTLFVTGLRDAVEVDNLFQEHNCEHIFFGANHSFKPKTNESWASWDSLIEHFLEQDILCSLDIPITLSEEFLDSSLVEYDNFIPQLRVPVPYIKLWNYNTMIKVDDKDFKATNPGVWTHSLHDLMDRNKFTSWDRYGLDKIIE